MVLIALTLAGCGLHPDGEHEDVVMGPNVSVGPVELLSVHVEAPPGHAYRAGDNARLWLTLYNHGREPDTLQQVSSSVATRAEIRWDDDCDGRFATVDHLTLEPGGPVPLTSPSGIPPFDAYHVRLVDLTRKVPAGTTVPITFRFRRAGTITVSAAVQPSVPRGEPSSRCAVPATGSVPSAGPSLPADGRGDRT